MKTGIDQLQPGHVAAGLGGANREFLSVCLGVFDDAKLSKRLEDHFRKAANKVKKWTPIRDLIPASESVASSFGSGIRCADAREQGRSGAAVAPEMTISLIRANSIT